MAGSSIPVGNSPRRASGRKRSPGRRIPGLPRYFQDYILCILLHMMLPLLPIGLQMLWQGSVDGKTLLLTAAMYMIAIGISSRNVASFGLSLVGSIAYAASYGVAVSTRGTPGWLLNTAWIGWVGIAAVFIMHLLERYNRHVVDRVPFFEFLSDGD